MAPPVSSSAINEPPGSRDAATRWQLAGKKKKKGSHEMREKKTDDRSGVIGWDKGEMNEERKRKEGRKKGGEGERN